MAFLFRWLMRAFLAMAALAAAGAGLAYYLAGQSLPDYDRTLTLEGPAAAIEILRDRNAVPHILATEGVAMLFEKFSKDADWLRAMGVRLEDPGAFDATGARMRRVTFVSARPSPSRSIGSRSTAMSTSRSHAMPASAVQ